jgi:PEP-CTERM motif-containing protein
MRCFTRLLVTAVAVVCVGAASPARASSISYSNLATSAPSYLGTPLVLSGGSSIVGVELALASSFSLSADASLDFLVLPLGYVLGTNAVDLYLMSDVAGVPGTIIEAFHLTNLANWGLSTPLVTATSLLNPLLVANAQYWVVAAAAGTSVFGWNLNNTGDLGLASRINGGNWVGLPSSPAGALQVNATVVPEPASLTLLAFGLAALAVIVRRSSQRKA